MLVGTTGNNPNQSVALGAEDSLALAADGTIWAWGANNYGQLGDGTNDEHHSPVHLTAPTSIIAVAAGRDHSLALASDGTVWAWGRNGGGQLGDGTTDDSSTPLHLANFAGPSDRTAAALVQGPDDTKWYVLVRDLDGRVDVQKVDYGNGGPDLESFLEFAKDAFANGDGLR